jgi:hypothetical protein
MPLLDTIWAKLVCARSKDTSSKDTSSKDTSSKDTSSKDTSSKDTIFEMPLLDTISAKLVCASTIYSIILLVFSLALLHYLGKTVCTSIFASPITLPIIIIPGMSTIPKP